jgi:anti-sigma regulatory factor (Ser/Thr protein kinase)
MSRISEVFLNRRHEIQRLGALAEAFGAGHRLSDDDMMAINLVLDEVITNIIDYGYDDAADHEIRVTMAVEGDQLTIEVEDDARHFDPLKAPPPDLDLPLEERPVGGLGIHIVRSLMSAVEYQRRGDRNVLTMRKTIGRS